MASLHSMSHFGSHGAKFKDSKPKTKAVVKPILKKWSQTEKEKKSLDLDRGWDEQGEPYRSTQGWGRSSSLSFYDQGTAGPDSGTGVVGGGASGTGGRVGLGVLGNNTTTARRYNHSRSISGTSQISGTTSNSSNSIPARHFVHPFQQTPHTSTPPLLSYANSLASIADTRDYSPTTITEDDDNDNITASTDPANNGNQHYYNNVSHNSSSVCIHNSNNRSHNPNSHSQPTLTIKLPSVPNQHTSTDISDANLPIPLSQPPLRVSTSRTSSSIPTHSSRLANVSSRSDLYLDRLADSPSSTLPPNTITSPSSSIAPMSPLRSSLDSGFRLRSKSDLDASTRAEHLRAARRKFEMKERLKDEKYAREQIKRREREDNKRAHEIEKQLAAQHKEQLAARAREEAAELEEALQRGKHNRKVSIASSGRPSLSIARPSLSLGRPSTSRKNTSSQMGESEKFMSNSYESTDPHRLPTYGRDAGSVQFTAPRRKNTAKRKTHSAWTAFILWLRTKLLRMSRS
ncbi:hypothetical protein GGR51DRAFT_115450 [Nemania sp. FL0031]|nr:hypothetical protein GGR51DRAFT_115450 [Nemania sp. FL0031]